MTLTEALKIVNAPQSAEGASCAIGLYCGFEPLHLATFLSARLRIRLNQKTDLRCGTYGDLLGTIQRALASPPDAAAVVVEWPDLDPRLGFRSGARWDGTLPQQIVEESRQMAQRLREALAALADSCVVALSGPTLPLPALSHTTPAQASAIEMELEEIGAALLRDASSLPNVRVIRRQRLDQISASADRLDLKLELLAGFPYRCSHADALAALIVDILHPQPPKKGLITDLDGVLWKGILGESGPSGVHWTLENAAQLHTLYQRELAKLGAQGVLLAVASKNDAELVQDALAREDMVVKGSSFFPVEANWGAKSESVRRILDTWNVGPDSVVFIDDTPMELAEVNGAFPEMQCLPFPANDPKGVWELIWTLRDLFGKPKLQAEDQLRASTVKSSAAIRQARIGATEPDFLRSLAGKIRFEMGASSGDRRAFELINKTNQFNLNGRRYSEFEWTKQLARKGGMQVSVTYEDRFGPLGKIAVLLLRVMEHDLVAIDTWVMSCRAFSRQIEHHTLDWLFQHFQASRLWLDHRQTPRNKPLSDFLASVPHELDGTGLSIHCRAYQELRMALPHSVAVAKDTHAALA